MVGRNSTIPFQWLNAGVPNSKRTQLQEHGPQHDGLDHDFVHVEGEADTGRDEDQPLNPRSTARRVR